MTNQPNTKLILRAYGILRQLTPDDLLVLELLRNLSETERELLVETLAPQKSTTKRTGKKSASKGASKSSRASGMAAAITRSLSQQREVVKNDPACGYVFSDETVCNRIEDNPVHRKDGGYSGYHPFVSPAPRAGAKSSTNGGATVTTANSEDETVSAGVAVGGSSE